jgi:hypothetical protein
MARDVRNPPRAVVYGTMYGMHRTTIYLPQELKQRLTNEARLRGVSEAELIRTALEIALDRPLPRGGIISSDTLIASRVSELLEGFGES